MQFSVNPDQKVFEKSPMKQHLSILGAVVGRLDRRGLCLFALRWNLIREEFDKPGRLCTSR